MSPRLEASIALRSVALSTEGELTRSAALLAELAAILRTYYRRSAVDSGGETVERVGPEHVRAWWVVHHVELCDTHRELAAHHLAAAGVPA